MVINHLLSGMILQVKPSQEKIRTMTTWKTPESTIEFRQLVLLGFKGFKLMDITATAVFHVFTVYETHHDP